MAYSKLHASIVNSSLWTENEAVRLLFITLLALCDQHGVVYGSKNGLSRQANIDPDLIEEAWDTLLGPDSDSSDKIRAPGNEGRRIEEVPGGFRLVNYAYYRGLRNDEERRNQNREAQARFRAKAKSKPRSATVIPVKPLKAQAEAEAEAETKTSPQAGTPVDPLDIPPPLHSPMFSAEWQRWMTFRRGLGKKPKDWKLMFGEQLEWLKQFGAERATEILSRSIRNGWQGLFPVEHGPDRGSGAERVSHEKELDRCREAMKRIRDGYGEHQSWTEEDKAKWTKLRERKRELEKLLGVQV